MRVHTDYALKNVIGSWSAAVASEEREHRRRRSVMSLLLARTSAEYLNR